MGVSPSMATTRDESRPQGTPGTVEILFAFILCGVLSRAFMYLIFPLGEDILAEKLLYMGAYAAVGLLLLRHWREVLGLLWREKFLLALLLLAALSTLWSERPRATVMHAAGLAGGSAVGIYLLLNFDVDRLLKVLCAVFTIIAVTSLIAALGFPEVGIMQGFHEGTWSGIYGHKNMLARYMVIAGVVFFCLAMRYPEQRRELLGCHFFALFLLSMSCSKSSHLAWLILFYTLAAYLALSGGKSTGWDTRRLALYACFSATLAFGSLGMQGQHNIYPPVLLQESIQCVVHITAGDTEKCSIFAAAAENAPPGIEAQTGRGRVKLWRLMGEKLQEAPALGFGLGGFWHGWEGPSAYVWQNQRWKAEHGHNGFMDLAVHLGLLGLVLLGLAIVVCAGRLVAALARGAFDQDRLDISLIIAAVILVNIGESELLRGNSLMWMLMLFGILFVQREQARAP